MFASKHRAGYLLFCIPSLALILALTGCESKPPAPPDTGARSRDALRGRERLERP